MALSIRFVQDRTGESGIHFIVDDGCEVNLDESQDLTPEQLEAIDIDNKKRNRNHLIYLNKSVSDFIRWEGIKLMCPICGENYTITEGMYNSALERFRGGTK